MDGSAAHPRHSRGSRRGGQFAPKHLPDQSTPAILSLDRSRSSSRLVTTLYGSPLVLVEGDGHWVREPSLQTSEFGFVSASFDPELYARRGMNVVIGEMTASLLNAGTLTQGEARAVLDEFAWMQVDSGTRKNADDEASNLELLRLLKPVWELEMQPIWCRLRCGVNGATAAAQDGNLYGMIDTSNDADCVERLRESLDDLVTESHFLTGHSFSVMLFRGTGEGFGARFERTIRDVYNASGLSQVDETFPAKLYEARFDPARQCCYEREGRDPRGMPNHFSSYHYGCVLRSQAHLTPADSSEFHAFVRDRLPITPHHITPANPVEGLLSEIAVRYPAKCPDAMIVEHMLQALHEAPIDRKGVTEDHFTGWVKAYLAKTFHPIQRLTHGFEAHPLMRQLLAQCEDAPGGTEAEHPIVPWWD